MAGQSHNRCAIYFAPSAGSALWQFGSSVIGYDAATGHDVPHPDDGHDWAALTNAPRRYGFHATLKAPFHLAAGTTSADVAELAGTAARRLSSAVLPGLKVAALGSFVALVVDGDGSAVAALAQQVVEALEPVRAPLSEADIARYAAKPLSERHKAQLTAFGYPYVGPDYRFHMTLTDSLPGDPGAIVERLAAHYRPIATRPVAIDQIAVYEQPDRQSRFRIIARFPLTA